MLDVSIEYCDTWNYEPRAVSLAEQLKETFEVEAKLVPSSGGCFEVVVDGDLIFSKLNEGRFPEIDEVLSLMKNSWMVSKLGSWIKCFALKFSSVNRPRVL